MNKTDFIKAVAMKTGFTMKDTKAVTDAMQEVVAECMANHEEVKIMDGLVLASVYKEARTARNPRTGEDMPVPAKWAPKAKLGKALKDAVNA